MTKPDTLVTPDLAALLLAEYHRIFDHLEQFPAHEQPSNAVTMADRADEILTELSHIRPTTVRGAMACLYAARVKIDRAIESSANRECDDLALQIRTILDNVAPVLGTDDDRVAIDYHFCTEVLSAKVEDDAIVEAA